MSTRTGLWGSIGDAVWRGLRLDAATHAVKCILYPHAEIHSGSSFMMEEGIQLNNAAEQYLISTPTGKRWAHMTINVSGAQDTSVSLDEGADCVGNNDTVVINRDRNSTKTSSVGIYRGIGNVVAAGTRIFTSQWGIAAVGGGKGGGGGDASTREELILKAGTKYVLTVTALSANANNITVSLDWYLHTNRN